MTWKPSRYCMEIHLVINLIHVIVARHLYFIINPHIVSVNKNCQYCVIASFWTIHI